MAALLLLAFLLLPGPILAHETSEFTIEMRDEGFFPQYLEIEQGDTVVFKNEGKNPHWPASNIHPTHAVYPELDPKKAILPGEAWSFIFKRAGEWGLHDHLYPKLTGRIIVRQDPDFREGPVSTVLNWVKALFGRIFGLQTSDTRGRSYDLSISEDSDEIFNNPDALYSYVRKFGPAKTTKSLHELQTSGFGFCHNPAHEAGRFAYEIFGAKAFKECTAECHSGCYHGATEAYFKENGTTDLTKSLKEICSPDLNSFYMHQCIHGVGHGLMAWSDYDIFESLSNCESLSGWEESCYSGVFMENIVGGLASEFGHFTEYLSQDPHYPCKMLEGKYKGACYFYQTSRMVQLFNGDFSKVAAACAEIDPRYQQPCFESMGRDIGGANRDDPLGAIKDCRTATEANYRKWCLAGAVQDSFWDPSGQGKALEFCQLLGNKAEKDICYATIINRAAAVLGAKTELENFCGGVEDRYKSSCFAQVK